MGDLWKLLPFLLVTTTLTARAGPASRLILGFGTLPEEGNHCSVGREEGMKGGVGEERGKEKEKAKKREAGREKRCMCLCVWSCVCGVCVTVYMCVSVSVYMSMCACV